MDYPTWFDVIAVIAVAFMALLLLAGLQVIPVQALLPATDAVKVGADFNNVFNHPLKSPQDLYFARVGEFGIATRMVQPKGAPPPEEGTPAPQAEPGATMVYRPRTPQPTEAATPEDVFDD